MKQPATAIKGIRKGMKANSFSYTSERGIAMICKRNENQQSSVIGNDFVDIPAILL